MNNEVVREAQQEFNALNDVMKYDQEFVTQVEVNIDHYSEEYDGSQSITEYVDMCIMLARSQSA